MAMQKEECASSCVGVFLVEIVDALQSEFHKWVFIFVQRPRGSVGEIGQQAKVDIGVLVREIAGLKFVE